jgi:hypothetical protein
MRGFFGGAGGKNGGKKTTIRAGDIAKQSLLKGGKGKTMSQDELFEEVLKQKMEAKKKELGYGGGKFGLPGTDPNQQKQPSKAAMMAIQKIAEKQAKKEMKRKAQEIELKPRFLMTNNGGGQIDKTGKVRDSSGRVIFTIDSKTGKVKNAWGLPVGRYDPNDSGSIYQLQLLIQNENQQRLDAINRSRNMLHNPNANSGSSWNGGAWNPHGDSNNNHSSWNGGAWNPNKDDKGWW